MRREPSMTLEPIPDIGMGTLKYLNKQIHHGKRGTNERTRGGRGGRGGRRDPNTPILERDTSQSNLEARIAQLESMLCDTNAGMENIRTEVASIDEVAQTAVEKSKETATHTQAIIEEVGTHAAKLNEYENGRLPVAMVTVVEVVVENRVSAWDEEINNNINMIGAMMNNVMKILIRILIL